MTEAEPSARPDETVRLAAYRHLEPEAAIGDPMLQRIASLAAHVTGASHAGLHFIDGTAQNRIAAFQAPLTVWPREDAFCTLVVDSGTPIAVEDATEDPRFAHLLTDTLRLRYYVSYPLTVEDGQVIGTVCAWDSVARPILPGMFEELDDLAALVVGRLESLRRQRILAEAAMTDPLTGLANRRLLIDTVDRALAAAQRRETGVAVLYLDLDGFKEINDELGHDVGDEVLRVVADRMRAELRANELVARLGGDEFVVLLDEATPESATRAGERLGEALREPIATSAGEVRVGASVGVATAADGEAGDALVRRADLAMYAAKAAHHAA